MLAAELIVRLRDLGLSVGTAESLTGGLVCASLTDVPGASAVVRGGVAAYATPVKAEVLGVDPQLLAAEGAVHPEVARQMAAGVRRVLRCDVGLATTGVAGPDVQDGKPVGTVFVAVDVQGACEVTELALTGDRAHVRRGSVDAVLGQAVRILSDR